MKLLVGVPNVWWGGLQSWSHYLADHLPEDFEVAFVCWNTHSPAVRDLARRGRVFDVGTMPIETGLQPALATVFDRWRPDVVQANCPPLAEVARHHGVPCVTTGHSLRGAAPNGAVLADAAVRVSPAVPGAERVILNGVAPVPWAETRQEHLVVMASRLDRDLNPHLAFSAMPLVRMWLPNVRFRVIGTSRDGHFDAQQYLEANGMADYVELCGLRSHDEARALMAEADVFLQPWPEAFGLSCCEAMAAGVVPVVSHKGYGPQMVDMFGVTTDTYTVAVAKALTRALTDDAFRTDALREQMAATTIAQYGADRFAAAYAQVYREVAGS